MENMQLDTQLLSVIPFLFTRNEYWKICRTSAIRTTSQWLILSKRVRIRQTITEKVPFCGIRRVDYKPSNDIVLSLKEQHKMTRHATSIMNGCHVWTVPSILIARKANNEQEVFIFLPARRHDPYIGLAPHLELHRDTIGVVQHRPRLND